MGTALREHLAGVDDIALAGELSSGGSVAELLAAAPDVVVDLSKGPGVDSHGPAIVKASVPYIVGATGYRPETLELLTGLADAADSAVLIAPNFSLGANLMVRFAAQAARLMDSPAITERHHRGKADAPSGTALFTAQRIAAARADQGRAGEGPSVKSMPEGLPGVRGGMVDGVAVHSLRGDGYLAEQEVRFSLPGESLLIEHRSIDRRCFMPGMIYAVRNISRVRGLVIGLDALLEL